MRALKGFSKKIPWTKSINGSHGFNMETSAPVLLETLDASLCTGALTRVVPTSNHAFVAPCSVRFITLFNFPSETQTDGQHNWENEFYNLQNVTMPNWYYV